MNPDAKEFVPGSRAIPIRASCSRASPVRLAHSPPKRSGDGGDCTPQASADMGKYVSGDLAFEDMFGHGSRQNSVQEPREATVLETTASTETAGVDAEAGAPVARPARLELPVGAASDDAGAAAAAAAGSRVGGPDADETPEQAAARATLEVAAARAELANDAPLAVQCVVTPAATPGDAPATAGGGGGGGEGTAAQLPPPPVAPPVKTGPQDFEILRVVGQGAFGKVFQVRHKADNTIYAMKVMRKDNILKKDHGEYVRSERDLLTAAHHPFIVPLRFSFQTPTKLYLVLDFVNGGHLFFNLYTQGTFDEPVARLYTAEMVCAIAYLHERGIVHRDLKPENVLLDSDGHIQITDFGLAKGDMLDESKRTNSFIGTIEYMAPEIIAGNGHGKAVDWWSIGVLLYEMLAGKTPFSAVSRPALQAKIVNSKPKYPQFFSPTALSLLKALLNKDPRKRLGSGPTGSADVRAHPFFQGINWARVEARSVESDYKPAVSSRDSVENFDKMFTGQRPVDSPCGTPTDAALVSKCFEGFSYVAPSFLDRAMAGVAVAAAAAAAKAAAESAGTGGGGAGGAGGSGHGGEGGGAAAAAGAATAAAAPVVRVA